MERRSRRGRAAGNSYPLRARHQAVPPLLSSTTCERLNERIRGNCNSLPRRIPVDPTIPAGLDEIVETVATKVNPDLVIVFGARVRGVTGILTWW